MMLVAVDTISGKRENTVRDSRFQDSSSRLGCGPKRPQYFVLHEQLALDKNRDYAINAGLFP